MAQMFEVSVTYEGPEGSEQVIEVHADGWLPPRSIERGGSQYVRRRYTSPTPEESASGLTACAATYVYRAPYAVATAPAEELAPAPTPVRSRRGRSESEHAAADGPADATVAEL